MTKKPTEHKLLSPHRRTVSMADQKVAESVLRTEDCKEEARQSGAVLKELFPELDEERDLVGDVLQGKQDKIDLSLDTQRINQEVREHRLRENKILKCRLAAIVAETKDLKEDLDKKEEEQKALKGKKGRQGLSLDFLDNAKIIEMTHERLSKLKSDFEKWINGLKELESAPRLFKDPEIQWLAKYFHLERLLK